MVLYIMLVGRYPFADATLQLGSPASAVAKDGACKAHGKAQGKAQAKAQGAYARACVAAC